MDGFVIIFTACCLAVVGFFAGMAAERANVNDAKYQGACESRGGHVAHLDQDHKVCLKNGSVIKW